jgi:2-C-methyl-D-erythritol 4-phosphate cytidylyltransferase
VTLFGGSKVHTLVHDAARPCATAWVVTGSSTRLT